MSQPTSRLLVTCLSKPARAHGSVRQPIRSFSQTCIRRADDTKRPVPPAAATIPESLRPQTQASPAPSAPSRRSPIDFPRTSSQAAAPSVNHNIRNLNSPLSSLSSSLSSRAPEQEARDTLSRALNQATSQDILGESSDKKTDWGEEPFHFHIYGHKHNTHITVTKPDRNSIISISAGQIGFRKSKRGTYDAAYQLCAYVMDKLNQGNWHREIHKLEVVLRGFGTGREAAIKVLLGNEGKLLRGKITKVSDATRLKFGGTRSPKPRRLG